MPAPRTEATREEALRLESTRLAISYAAACSENLAYRSPRLDELLSNANRIAHYIETGEVDA